MSFHSDLDYSQKQSRQPYWGEAYKRYFGDEGVTSDLIIPVEKRPDSGADKIVYLSTGQTYTVDEKCHRKSNYVDDKVFLEYEHVYQSGSIKQGWVVDKTKNCDYIAYAKEATHAVYIFPLRELQQVFEKNRDSWLWDYKKTETANNKGTTYEYRSCCVLVPAPVIQEALQKHFVVSVPAQFWH